MSNPHLYGISIFKGTLIIEDANCCELVLTQIKFPKTKKARIQRKWRWQSKNWQLVSKPLAYHIPSENLIICHPTVAAQLRSLSHA